MNLPGTGESKQIRFSFTDDIGGVFSVPRKLNLALLKLDRPSKNNNKYILI